MSKRTKKTPILTFEKDGHDFTKLPVVKKQNSPSINKLKRPTKNGEIDLCADINQQPVNFAKWYHDSIMEMTAVKLKLTPEVLQAIEDCKAQQEAILELKFVDWKLASETYVTI